LGSPTSASRGEEGGGRGEGEWGGKKGMWLHQKKRSERAGGLAPPKQEGPTRGGQGKRGGGKARFKGGNLLAGRKKKKRDPAEYGPHIVFMKERKKKEGKRVQTKWSKKKEIGEKKT